MSSKWTISVRPPFVDDAWAIIRARFVDAQYWHAETKQDAIARLKEHIKNPRNVPGNNPPVIAENIRLDNHEDFENQLTIDQLFSNQLGFGAFGNASEYTWFQHQDELEILEPIIGTSQILHVTSGDGPDDHPSDWNWGRSLWIKHLSDNEFDIYLHRPERYTWVKKQVETSEAIRILQGRWHEQSTTDTGSHHLKQFYYERSITDDQCSGYLKWVPGQHEYKEAEETPFGENWDFCPGFPSLVNGWTYDPFARLGREVWRNTEVPSKPRVELHHHYDDFSFLKVYDGRVSGADSAMIPDGFKSKRQATADPGDLRERAIAWMKQNSPGRITYPSYDKKLRDAPEGWDIDGKPGVRSGNEFYVRYIQPVTEDARRAIVIEGRSGSTDFNVKLRYELESEHGRNVKVSEDPNPIDLPTNCSIDIAYLRAKKLGKQLNNTDIDQSIHQKIQNQSENAIAV